MLHARPIVFWALMSASCATLSPSPAPTATPDSLADAPSGPDRSDSIASPIDLTCGTSRQRLDIVCPLSRLDADYYARLNGDPPPTGGAAYAEDE